MASAYHDGDHVPVLLATSSSDGETPVLVWADPTTHRLLVSSSVSFTFSAYTETPSGLINGVNTVYTTINATNFVFGIYLNGEFIHPADYTVNSSGFTMNTPLPASMSGLDFTIVYQAGTSSSTFNFATNEIVSGSGTSWTLANTPITGSVQLYGSGIALTPGAENDYTISGSTITTTNSYSAGVLLADYRY